MRRGLLILFGLLLLGMYAHAVDPITRLEIIPNDNDGDPYAETGGQDLTLNWNAPSGATVYQVDQKETSQGDGFYVTLSSVIATTTYRVTGLTVGTSYTFRVYAGDPTFESTGKTVVGTPMYKVGITLTGGSEAHLNGGGVITLG